MSFPYLGETKELNESTRKDAAGSFIKLPDGITHYDLGGPTDGKKVVLVHGFSVPYFIFDPTFDFLINSGYRVLRYDLFGRGFSDRPRAVYGIPLFVKQLADLLDALNFDQVTLLGLSMGGPISTTFIDRFPERVSRHILIDPAGARPIQLSAALKAAKMPLIGELALGLFGSENMVKSLASDFFSKELIEEFQSKYKIQLQYKGFMRGILSSLRSGTLDSFYEVYARVGNLRKPTLLFWGKKDTTVPFDHSAVLLAALPHAEFHAIEDCGHIPHYEKPHIVNPILKKFLEIG